MNTFNAENACCFTGHRAIPQNAKKKIRECLREKCIDLIENHGVCEFIAGGALGFDTMAALEIIELKQIYPNIRLHLYYPCTNQSERWSAYYKKIWDSIKLLADDYRYVSDMPYITGCMQLRNKAMVNDAKHCIAYCVRKSSGTATTLNYATGKGRNIIIISDI